MIQRHQVHSTLFNIATKLFLYQASPLQEEIESEKGTERNLRILYLL